MIPNDLAARLRLLTESVVNPVSAVHEISAELPELAVGQRFTARIESALPDGSFRALVTGRSLTLALPQSAAPGDTLELVVAARTPRLIVAEQAAEGASRQSPPTLSRAARMIGTLLAGDEAAPRPATISRAAPLLPAAQPLAALLAPALRQAIVESGLFYEAHQALWVAGRYPAEALAREPQARRAPPQPAPQPAAASQTGEAAPAGKPPADAVATGAAAARGVPAAELPAELQPLVHQQLNAAATAHLVWRGEIWPGQNLHWEIEERRDEERDAQGETGEETAAAWSTRLALTLPRLGALRVALDLNPAKVSLAITADADGATALRQGLGELAAAFAAAGLPPLAAGVDVDTHEPA
ncbi:MAG TPA: flagellar hook-length control protein FliK [Candidatus Desulfobacillus denitrificans]|nr:flagellar hook-length control protein FliK [Candidatus Desulfobacillus denitrificans]